MSEKKPRGEAVLKNLPDALQEELWQFCRRTTYAKAAAWLLKDHGVKVSEATLSVFFSWYPRSRMLRMAAASSSELESALTKLPELKMQAAQAREVAQISFEIQAAQNRDAELFLALGKAARETEKLKLDSRRITILEKKAALADQATGIEKDSTLSEEEKAARMRALFRL